MRIEAYNQIQQIYNDSKLKKTQSVSKTGKTDQVEISSLGKDIQTAKKAVTQTPDVRTELTDPLKKQVQDGTYDVDGMTFAERLLEKYNELS